VVALQLLQPEIKLLGRWSVEERKDMVTLKDASLLSRVRLFPPKMKVISSITHPHFIPSE